jgi:VWFA-related protein
MPPVLERRLPPRSRRVACAASAVLAALMPFATSGQQVPSPAPSQPTFRSTTTLVQVDAIVHDKDGNFITGLSQDDLTLLEDGKPQKIQQFYLVSHYPAEGTDPAAAASMPDSEEQALRVFIILFDEGHLANDSLLRVQKGAEQFIREQMRPGDFGGIFVNGGMYHGRLTTSKTELIAGVRTARPSIDNRQALLAPFREFPRIPGEIDATRIAEGARQLVDSLGVDACREDPFQCDLEGGLQQVENLIEKKARHYVRQARVLTANTIQNLQYVNSRLSRIPGRKTLVLLSEGFYVEESRSLLLNVAAQAARGGTTIYSIDGRGLFHGPGGTPDVTEPSMTRSTAFDTGEDGPTILAGGTGGLRVRNIDDISRAFGMIVRDTSTYYVIGYQPENLTLDGKFRKIEVKAKRGGISVRARKGYLATALPPLELKRGGGLR